MKTSKEVSLLVIGLAEKYDWLNAVYRRLGAEAGLVRAISFNEARKRAKRQHLEAANVAATLQMLHHQKILLAEGGKVARLSVNKATKAAQITTGRNDDTILSHWTSNAASRSWIYAASRTPFREGTVLSALQESFAPNVSEAVEVLPELASRAMFVQEAICSRLEFRSMRPSGFVFPDSLRPLAFEPAPIPADKVDAVRLSLGLSPTS